MHWIENEVDNCHTGKRVCHWWINWQDSEDTVNSASGFNQLRRWITHRCGIIVATSVELGWSKRIFKISIVLFLIANLIDLNKTNSELFEFLKYLR